MEGNEVQYLYSAVKASRVSVAKIEEQRVLGVKTRHSSPFSLGNLRRRAWKRGEGSYANARHPRPTHHHHHPAGSPQPKQLKNRRRGGEEAEDGGVGEIKSVVRASPCSAAPQSPGPPLLMDQLVNFIIRPPR
jgi:hypothetical protein